jgi:predicted CoA-binding protein
VIEGLATIPSIKQLTNPSKTSLSVITPPEITKQVLKDAAELGIKHVWLQPGSEPTPLPTHPELNIIQDCILVSGERMLHSNKM